MNEQRQALNCSHNEQVGSKGRSRGGHGEVADGLSVRAVATYTLPTPGLCALVTQGLSATACLQTLLLHFIQGSAQYHLIGHCSPGQTVQLIGLIHRLLYF